MIRTLATKSFVRGNASNSRWLKRQGTFVAIRAPPATITSSHDHGSTNSTVESWHVVPRRRASGISGLASWMTDVIRTRSLQPPNPILQGIKSGVEEEEDGNSTKQQGGMADNMNPTDSLPKFSQMLPYHLDAAAQEVSKQYAVDLANLEVTVTSAPRKRASSVAAALDRVEAPVYQVQEVGRLFSQLGSDDNIAAWRQSHRKATTKLSRLGQKESKIIYQALQQTDDEDKAFPDLLGGFQQNGVTLDDKDQSETLNIIQKQLQEKLARLSMISDYESAKKAAKLQAVSDMYNVIGLSQQQATQLGYNSTIDMATQNQIGDRAQISSMMDEVVTICSPHVVRAETLNSEIAAGAFISAEGTAAKQKDKNIWEANRSVKKLLALDGVIRGFSDFCDGLIGIKLVEETGTIHGWQKDVRLFHLYDADVKTDAGENGVSSSSYLGSFYIDPYARKGKSSKPFARLFTKRSSQTAAPLAIVSFDLAAPAWDNDPSPLNWGNTQSVLFHLGTAVQLVLNQLSAQRNQRAIPTGIAGFMGNFMVLWLENEGFLQRLATLSQDQFTFNDELITFIREIQIEQKATQLMDNLYLAKLESEVFGGFDPRGDETLIALQNRLAKELIPYNIPGISDFTPTLGIFHSLADSNFNSDYVFSDILSANVFKRFKDVDVADQDEVKKLGRAIKETMLQAEGAPPPSLQNFVDICGKDISVAPLQELYHL